MLQGDVGSGKTLVALWAMLTTIEAGAQAALLAPTEVLARQHHESIRALLEPLNIKVGLLLGQGRVANANNDKNGNRPKISQNTTLHELASGTLSVVVGTHALLSEKVEFKNLGLLLLMSNTVSAFGSASAW